MYKYTHQIEYHRIMITCFIHNYNCNACSKKCTQRKGHTLAYIHFIFLCDIALVFSRILYLLWAFITVDDSDISSMWHVASLPWDDGRWCSRKNETPVYIRCDADMCLMLKYDIVSIILRRDDSWYTFYITLGTLVITIPNYMYMNGVKYSLFYKVLFPIKTTLTSVTIEMHQRSVFFHMPIWD